MSVEVNTLEFRETYVKGQVTTGDPDVGFVACGPGTAHPVPATLDQIAEIFYRVRDTKISGGEYTMESTELPYKYAGLFNTGPLPAHNYHIEQSGDWLQHVIRGYSFGAESPNEGWLKHHCDPVYTSPIGGDFHDAKDEFCMWPDDDVYTGSMGANHEILTGYSGGSVSAPSVYGPYYKRTWLRPDPTPDVVTYYGDRSTFVFYPQVAFTGAASPFDPAATLYPRIFWGNNTWFFGSEFGSEASTGSAEIVLSSSTLLIPIRASRSGYTVNMTSPPKLTVTKWWPYAKPDGSPVWNSTTGGPGV